MRCRVCGITEDAHFIKTGRRFYDSGKHRPLCSKECYSIIFDDLMRNQERAAILTRNRTRERRAQDPEYRESHNEVTRAYKRKQREKGLMK